MGSLKLTTASSGSVILSPANTASDVTITVPAVTGTMLTTASTFAGTGPAFSAYQSTLQSIPNATFTKVQFQTEEFDTANCFDNVTNYRFTPTVAGYYQINCAVGYASGAGRAIVGIYKNGSEFKRVFDNGATSYNNGGTALISCNGTTDYIEIYAFQASGSAQNTNNSQLTTFFQASMVRSA